MQKGIHGILTNIFRAITGTRHKARRRQVTGIPLMPITLGVASPSKVPAAATAPDTPVTTMSPAQEALAVTTVPVPATAATMPPTLTTPAATNCATITETDHELSVPETILLAQPTTNESQFGASYLNNCVHQVVQITSTSMCSSHADAQKNLKSHLNEIK